MFFLAGRWGGGGTFQLYRYYTNNIVVDIWYPVWLFRYIYRTYDDRGKCAPIGGAHRSATMRTHNLQKPARLYWDISPKLAGIIENAVRVAQKVNILPNLCEVQTILRKKPFQDCALR